MGARAGFDGEHNGACGRGVEPDGQGGKGDAVGFGDRGERRRGLGEVGDDPGGEGLVGVEVERGWRGGRDHEYG